MSYVFCSAGPFVVAAAADAAALSGGGRVWLLNEGTGRWRWRRASAHSAGRVGIVKT